MFAWFFCVLCLVVPGQGEAVKPNQISMAVFHTVALKRDGGAAVSWNKDEASETPGPFTQVAAAGCCELEKDEDTPVTCGILENKRMKCWYGVETQRSHKPAHEMLRYFQDEYKSLSGNGGAICALQLDGTVECARYDGDVPGPVTEEHLTSQKFDKIAVCHETHACGIKKGTKDVACFSFVPGNDLTVPSDAKVKDLFCAESALCGIQENDELKCWPLKSAIAQSFSEQWTKTKPLFAGKKLKQILASGCICGLGKDDGKAICVNDLGAGKMEVPDVAFSQLAAARGNICGIREDNGHVQCWGEGTSWVPATVPEAQRNKVFGKVESSQSTEVELASSTATEDMTFLESSFLVKVSAFLAGSLVSFVLNKAYDARAKSLQKLACMETAPSWY